MADERDGIKPYKDSEKQSGFSKKDDRTPLDDLEAGTDDIEKVKGGRRGDPCDGGEFQ